MKTITNTHHSIKVVLFTAALILMLVSISNAQQIKINQRSHLVMNGNVQLVVNNAAFNNNGNFAASNSTVVITGNTDTTISYVGGTNATTFNNLSISKSANGVQLKSVSNVKNTLTVDGGTLFTDSTLFLKSDAALTARVAEIPTGCNIIGKTNVERYIPSRRAWRLMTAPLTNANSIYNSWQNKGVYTPGIGTLISGPNAGTVNGLDVSPQSNTSMRMWNFNTQQFVNVTNTYVSISAENKGSADNTGYFIFVRGDRDLANYGTANSNITTLTCTGRLQVGNQSFTVSPVSGAMSLIGNPYASPVDFSKLNRTNLMNRFYVWDATINILGGYVMLDDLSNSGTYTKSVGASNQTKDIQSGQAFFIQTLNNGNASLGFTENCKSAGNNNLMFRPTTPNTPANLPSQFLRTNLYIVNTDNSLLLADGIFAEFNNNYSDSVLLEDAPKFTNINENIAFLRNGNSLAAERRPMINANDTLFLKLWKTTQRTYQFEFIPTNFTANQIILVDNYLNTTANLNVASATAITFSIDANAASAATNRFMIVFKNFNVLPVNISSIKAYQQNNNIAVEWKVENEINMVKYEVEKATNGISFSAFSSKMVLGNNNRSSVYNVFDINPETGNNFYRIKSFDQIGQVKYSAIVKVIMNKSTVSSMSIYPNPVTNNIINLQLSNQPEGNYQLRVTNLNGQTIYTTSLKSNSNNATLSINVPSKLYTGIYQLEILNPAGERTIQQVIVK